MSDAGHSHSIGRKFGGVLARVNLKAVSKMATELRMRENNIVRSRLSRSLQRFQLSCKIVGPPLHGSYNLLFPVRFRDGIQWLLKIPANGHDGWDEASARALTSEVVTMKHIYSNSAVPVPRIYGYNSTLDNPVRCPYVLMERFEGSPLHHGWYYQQGPPEQLDRFRARALADIARAMAELNKFVFPEAGGLHNNAEEGGLQIGVYRKVDHFAARPRVGFGLDDDTTHFIEQGPFVDPRQYFLASLDKKDVTKLSCRHQGQHKLLRLFIEWFLQITAEAASGFVLAHPDFNLQNVLVKKDGSLIGFVDWEGVAVVPRCIGCEEYPLWLTPDWDPYWWNYDAERGCVKDEDYGPTMTPEELQKYRETYAQSIETTSGRTEHDSSHAGATSMSSQLHRHRSVTKLSSLARSLYIAANEPQSLWSNVTLIVNKIIDLTADDEYDDSLADSSSGTHFGFNHSGRGSDAALSDIMETLDEEEIAGQNLNVDGKLFLSEPGDKIVQGFTMAALTVHYDPSSTQKSKNPRNGDEAPASNQQDSNLPLRTPSGHSLENTIQQEQPDVSSTTRTEWHGLLPGSTVTPVHYLLTIPAFFMLFADCLQSFDLIPTGVLFASLLSMDDRSVSSFLAFLLGGLLYAQIIDRSLRARGAGSGQSREANGVRQKDASGSCRLPKRKERSQWMGDRDNSGGFAETVDNSEFSTQNTVTIPSTRNSTSRATRKNSDEQPISAPADHQVPSLADEDNNQIPSAPSPDLTYEEQVRAKWAEDPSYDFGSFTPRCIYNALYKDALDDERMERLKRGFVKLLAKLDPAYEGVML
ncbi:MAG: hypothetical protein Q9222_005828 [Ikaeria aurantiellina]